MTRGSILECEEAIRKPVTIARQQFAYSTEMVYRGRGSEGVAGIATGMRQ